MKRDSFTRKATNGKEYKLETVYRPGYETESLVPGLEWVEVEEDKPMKKHYKDYTVGELLDAGFHVDLSNFKSSTREEAKEVLNEFGGLPVKQYKSHRDSEWYGKYFKDFKVIAHILPERR